MKKVKFLFSITLLCVLFSTRVTYPQVTLSNLKTVLETDPQDVINVIKWKEKPMGDKVYLYPQLSKLRSHSKMVIMDSKGQITVKDDFGSFYKSPGFKYYCVGTFSDINFKYELFDQENKRITEKYLDLSNFSIWHKFALSDHGASVIIKRSNTQLIFEDSLRNLISDNTRIFPSGVTPEIEIFAKFLPNSNDLIVLAERKEHKYLKDYSIENPPIIIKEPVEPSAVVRMGKSQSREVIDDKAIQASSHLKKSAPATKPNPLENLALVRYDCYGNEKWRNYLDYIWPNKLYISDSGEYIIVVSSQILYKNQNLKYAIYLFSGNGQLINKIEREKVMETGIPFEIRCSFSQSEQNCLLGNANWVIKLNTANGEIEWEKVFPWKTGTINAETKQLIGVTSGIHNNQLFTFILAADYNLYGNRRIFLNPHIIGLDERGEQISAFQFSSEKYEGIADFYINPTKVSPDMSQLYFYLGNKIYSLDINK